ncbi:DUF1146 domain-containing protein [Enterococcus sp. MJM12]|uniref:DUF1146 domain-containing protein n=1 Tax=Candidatus Enterococcus myersii TaxID=2815322 RepID=A0ABS3HA04_9ENTE|nr:MULTISPECIES: DUF1146 family protein [Enterococcus]MBO0450289.1 DUF1146 domain-containing protein [Enterococcus sp. MJM12]MCD1023946.1 DUF1146 family protein [Enterococcus sp. SMC-9]MDT2739609.1 DUF1146 family protein [Enterococcus canintestini]
MQVYGVDAIVRIISHFAFVYLAFWGLRSLRLDTLFKSFQTAQIRIVILMLAISLGYLTSSFFLEILNLLKNTFLSIV